MYDLPLPTGEQQMRKNCTDQTFELSTALGHQMPLPGDTSDSKLPFQLHSVQCQVNHM